MVKYILALQRDYEGSKRVEHQAIPVETSQTNIDLEKLTQTNIRVWKSVLPLRLW